MLAEIGSPADAEWLRGAAASSQSLRPQALAITQRLAEPIFLHDLGAVEVHVGRAGIRKPLRRKVLALLCYLASRPRMAANREQAIEALWSDLNPVAAGNSLHQAVYYMRRVFEPDFREGMSANYIEVDGDVVSVNDELVDSASRACWRLLSDIRHGHTEAIHELVETYVGKFALTFAYDEWAESYRENLHAAVLAASKSSMARCRAAMDYEAGIDIGHRILSVDPRADAIEYELLRAYKVGGRPLRRRNNMPITPAMFGANSAQSPYRLPTFRRRRAIRPPSTDRDYPVCIGRVAY